MKRRRILYLLNGLELGGAENGLLTLHARGLFEGCDLRVATLIGGRREMADRFAAAGLAPTQFSTSPRMALRHLALGGLQLAATIARWRPDVLILSLPQANLVGRLIGRLLRTPTIIAFEHNAELAREAYVRLYRATAGCVDVVFADAPSTLETVLQAHYHKPPRVARVAPLASFTAPPPLQPWPREPHFVAVGRLTSVKNHVAAIEAIALLRARGVPARLTIFGEGPERPRLEALLAERQLSEAVQLPGTRPRWWESGPFSGFVLTSRHEGLCIVALEAMWAGIPCVAPLIGGLKDYADPGAMIVLKGVDPESTAAGLLQLLAEPAGALLRVEHARDRVMRLYGENVVAAQLAALNAELRDGFKA